MPWSLRAEGGYSGYKAIPDDPARPVQMGSPASLCPWVGDIDAHQAGRRDLPIFSGIRRIEQGCVERQLIAIITGGLTLRRDILKHQEVRLINILINLTDIECGQNIGKCAQTRLCRAEKHLRGICGF